MPLHKLQTHRVAKPWGRHRLWPGFEDPAPGGEPIGEIWFADERTNQLPLLIKYLFTSERLSIQVHPDDALARAEGHARGKDEAWLILAADEMAEIGIGLVHDVSDEELRTAALDGSIVDLLDWKNVQAGDYIYSPAGTVHAIGPGITMIEVQQNIDLTYRLYDYGRPRELHLDKGLAASDPVPFRPRSTARNFAPGRDRLNHGPKFTVERWTSDGAVAASADTPVWIVPIAGEATLAGAVAAAGTCWLADEPGKIIVDGDILLASESPEAFG